MTENNVEESAEVVEKRSSIPVGAIAIVFTLGLLFLKLAGLIDISWWWVFAPVGVVAAVSLVFAILAFLVVTAIALLAAVANRGRE